MAKTRFKTLILLVLSLGFAEVAAGSGLETEDLFANLSLPKTLQRHLVLYYPFDPGTDPARVPDLSGNRFHGDLHGGLTIPGKEGASFDGDDDYVSIPGIHLQDFTFMALIRTPTPSSATGADLSPLSNRYLFLLDGDKGHYALRGNQRGSLTFAAVVHGLAAEVTEQDGQLPADTWTAIAVSYDGRTVRLFRDGKLTGNGTVPGDDIAGTAFLGTGRRGGAANWRGSIDEVLLFDTALSSEQLQALHSNMAPAQTPAESVSSEAVELGAGLRNDLVLHYSFDERSASQVHDASGSDRHATIHGGRYEDEGWHGSGFSFDGEDDFLSTEGVHLDEFTFSAFVKTVTPPTKENTNNRRLFLLHGGPSYYALQGNSRGSVGFDATGHQGLEEYDWSFEPHTWTHVAVTYARPSVRIYRNGQLTEAGEVDAAGVTGTLFIGGTNQHYGRFWHGMIDEVRVFARALNEAEVQVLYRAAGPSQPGSIQEEVEVTNKDHPGKDGLAGVWVGLAVDKPESGTSRDSFALILGRDEHGRWQGLPVGSFFLVGNTQRVVYPEVKDDEIRFQGIHRTDQPMAITLTLVDGQLRGQGLPVGSVADGDRCDIALDRVHLGF